jgi:hypothetical protein
MSRILPIHMSCYLFQALKTYLDDAVGFRCMVVIYISSVDHLRVTYYRQIHMHFAVWAVKYEQLLFLRAQSIKSIWFFVTPSALQPSSKLQPFCGFGEMSKIRNGKDVTFCRVSIRASMWVEMRTGWGWQQSAVTRIRRRAVADSNRSGNKGVGCNLVTGIPLLKNYLVFWLKKSYYTTREFEKKIYHTAEKD